MGFGLYSPMKNRFLSLTLLLSLSSYAQIEHSSYSRVTEKLGGMNSCEPADFDEYSFVEKNTTFNRSTPLKSGQAADFDHEVEALMFSEGAGSSYRFSQCQRQLLDHLEKGLQDSGEIRSLTLRRAAWVQFNYLRTNIRNTIKDIGEARSFVKTVRSGIAYGEPGERMMMAMQEARGMESQRQKLQKAQETVTRLEARLSSLVSRIPLGNRPGMKEMLISLAKTSGNVSEAQFNAAFERQIIQLNAQARKSLEFWESHINIDKNGKLSARVDNDLKIALLESGQMDMVASANNMSERSQKEFMCRSRARYVSGPQNRDNIIGVASMIGGYGLARLAVRAGLKAAVAANAADKLGGRLVQVPALAAWIGLEASAIGVDIDHARRTCFRPEFISGVNEKQCSFESEYEGVFYEASAAECVTSSLLAAAPASMSVLGALSALPKTVKALDGSVITTNIPGVRQMIDLPNGGGRITHYDTGIKLTEGNGLRVSEYPESSSIRKITEKPGEFKETLYRDGRVTRENADNTRIETAADGSRVTYDKNGRIRAESSGDTIVVVGSRNMEDLKVRRSTSDVVLRGLQKGGPKSDEAMSNLGKLGFKPVKTDSKDLIVFRNSKSNASLTFKAIGKPRLTSAQSKDIQEILIQRRGDYVHPDALAKSRALSKSGDDIAADFEKVRSMVGTKMDEPEIEAFVKDELNTFQAFPAAEKKAAMEKLVGKVRNWDSASNIKNRILSKARQSRFERDVKRFRRKLLKSKPEIDEANLLRLSEEAALAKRARISELRGMCTTIRPNAANLKAGALFASFSGGLGAMNAGISYGAATWDSDMSRTTWGIRLTYEVVMSYLFNLWTARITAKPDSSFFQRVTQQNVLAFMSNIVDAGIYQHFFNTKEEAQKELQRLAASPTFVEDMNKLIDHVKNKGHMEKVIDGMGDFSNNLVRAVTGNEQIENLSAEELKNLDQEALKDPIVQEQLLDLIDDKMLVDGGISTGNMGVDRLAYNTVYNLPSVPVNMAIGMFAFQAVCMNLDSPVKAIAAFGGITFTRQFTNGYIFFESREKVLGSL